MRSRLYTALVAKLKEYIHSDGTPIIRHYDLWNRQVEFLDDETPFALPAIFIEFPRVEWATPTQSIQRATVPIVLHVVSQYSGSESDGSRYQANALERLNIVDGLAEHLYNWRFTGDGFSVQQTSRTASDTNHDHGELIEDIESFTCTVINHAAVPQQRPIYAGFGHSPEEVAASDFERPSSRTARGNYTATNTSASAHFYILAPANLAPLTTFTMGGVPFVMERTVTAINGLPYNVYRSGATFGVGTQVDIVAG